MFLSGGSLVTKTPIMSTTSYFPSMPPMSSPTWPSAYSGMYRGQLWVYVVVSKLAKAAARLPLPVYQRDDQNRPRVDDHPMARLLASPNPGLSGFDLWLWTSSTFDIFGEAFWLKKRQRGQVVGLYPLHPTGMYYDKGVWEFRNSDLTLSDIPTRDLVHFRAFDPDSQTRGMSPLEPLRATLENEWAARTATSSFWQRGARPGTVLTHPGNISQPAQDRLKAQWADVAAGSGNTGATVLLEEGMKPEVIQLTAEEAQYIETRKLNREEVCAAYDVPPPVVHILDRATFSNITEQMRSMYRDTMAPRLRQFEATIELDLRQAEWAGDAVYAEFLMDEVLRGDFEARQDALAKASHMTIAEKRKIENLPFIDGTDRIFLNTATMPLDAIDNQAAALAAATSRQAITRGVEQVETKARSESHVEHAQRVLADFFTRQGSAVHQGWDRERWDKELADELYAVNVLVATAAGRKTLEGLGLSGDSYDKDRTVDWLRANADGVATAVNTRTADDVAAAKQSDEPQAALTALFAGYVLTRAPQLAESHVTSVSGFGTTEAARQTGRDATKTWITGPKPRASHAAMNGETVGLDDTFSNGARWPGDTNLSADENAGCNCTVSVDFGKGITGRSMALAMGRLSRPKGLSEVDPGLLIEGLNGDSAAVKRALDDEIAAGGSVTGLRERIRALAKE